MDWLAHELDGSRNIRNGRELVRSEVGCIVNWMSCRLGGSRNCWFADAIGRELERSQIGWVAPWMGHEEAGSPVG